MKLKQILAGVLTAAMVVTSVPVSGLGAVVASAEETQTPENVAQTATIQAYTGTCGLRENSGGDSSPETIIDGITDDGTKRWVSSVRLMSGVSGDSPIEGAVNYVVLDLGEDNTKTELDHMVLTWNNAASAKHYKIETSDTCTVSGDVTSEWDLVNEWVSNEQYKEETIQMSDVETEGWETVAEFTASAAGTSRVDTLSGDALQSTKLKRYVRLLIDSMYPAGFRAAGLREFKVYASEPETPVEPEQPVEQKTVLEEVDTWTLRDNAFANSEKNPASGTDGPAAWAFNNDYKCWWHSAYGATNADGIRIGSKFGESIKLKKITYRGRRDSQNFVSGRFEGYELYTTNEENVTDDTVYTKTAEGAFDWNGFNNSDATAVQAIVLEEAVDATAFYIRLTDTSATNKTASSIRVFKEVSRDENAFAPLQGLTATADSEQGKSLPSGEELGVARTGDASDAVDGDPGTYWHSYYDSDAEKKVDFSTDKNNNFYIKLAEPATVQALTYLPRERFENNSVSNGWIKACDVSYTTENVESASEVQNWTEGATYTKEMQTNAVEGYYKHNFETNVIPISGTPKNVTFIKIHTTDARYDSGKGFINAAEFGVIGRVEEEEPEVPVTPADKIVRKADLDEVLAKGAVELTEEELAFLNSFETLAMSVVFRYSETPVATSGAQPPLFSLIGDEGALTWWHNGIESGSQGKDGVLIPGQTGFAFTKAGALVNDTKWHKLTMIFNKHEDGKYGYLISKDGNAYFNDPGWNPLPSPANNTDWQSVISNLMQHKTLTNISSLLIGQKLNGDNAVDFNGDIKCVEITGQNCVTAEEELVVNNAVADDVKAAFDEYVAGLAYEEAGYTAESWAPYAEAKSAADAATTEWAMYNAYDALEAAIAGLVEAEDPELTEAKEALQTLVEEADALTENDYTADSWTALAEKLAAAKAELEKEDATVETLTAAKEALAAAKENLKTPAEAAQAELQKALDAVSEVYEAGNDNSVYTADTCTTFDNAYKVAEALKNSTDVDAINAAIAALSTARAGLVLAAEPAGKPAVKFANDTNAVDAELDAEATESREASLTDVSANPATLTSWGDDPLVVETITDGDQTFNAFTGKYALNSGVENDKFNLTDSKKVLFNFKMYLGTKPQGIESIIGKLDEGYGVQIKSGESKLLFYGRDRDDNGNSQVWPTVAADIDDSFYGTWHEIVAMYDGTALRLNIDGAKNEDGTLKWTSETKTWNFRGITNPFTIGYNLGKESEKYQPYSGKLANVKLYAADAVTGETADDIAASLQTEANLILDLKAEPAVEGTEATCEVTSTTWVDAEGNEVTKETAFEDYKDYTATVVVTAKDGYLFADADKVDAVKVGDASVKVVSAEISADRKTMTIVHKHEGGEDPKVAAKEALDEAVEAATATAAAGNENGKYTEDSWKAFDDAYKAATAEGVADKSAKEIQALADALTAAQEGLTAAQPPVQEDIVIGGFEPIQMLTELKAYGTPVNPVITLGEGGTHYDTVADRAANPVGLAAANDTTLAVAYDDGWGYSGQLRAVDQSKFDVTGSMIMRFKVKSEKPDLTGEQCVQLVGKMNKQYGVQMKQDCLLLYCADANGSWPEVDCAIDDTFWGKWHDVMVVFTGKKMQLYVDGVPGEPKADRVNKDENYEVALKSDAGSEFTTGYNNKANEENHVKFTMGKLSDIQLYAGTDYTENLTKPYAAVVNALDEAAPVFNLTFTPYQTSTKWYTAAGDVLAADAQFAAEVVYKSVTTLKAHDGYKFADWDVTGLKGKGVEDASWVLSEGGKIATLTITYKETDPVECTCDVANLTFEGATIAMGTAASKDYTLNATADVIGDCQIPGHGGLTISYDLISGEGASVNGSVLTVTKPGIVEVRAVAAVSGREDGHSIQHNATFTVTSDKATDAEKQALTNAINDAASVAEADYTADSWKAFADALEAARAVANNANASKDDVNKAKADLAEAQSKLVTKLAAAQAAILKLHEEVEAEKAAGKDADYTAESWNRMLDALNAAIKKYNESTKPGSTVTGDELQALVDAALAEREKLVLKEAAALEQAKAELDKALAAAKAILDAGQKDYTDASWKAFKDAYEKAVNAPANANSVKLLELLSGLTGSQKKLEGKTPVAPVEELKVGDTQVHKNVLYRVTNAQTKTVIAVKGMTKGMKKVAIPATVKVKGIACKVTEIEANAFKNFKKLKKVTIGKNVKTIKAGAFFKCKKLKTVVVKGKSLKVIGRKAFKKTAGKVTVRAKGFTKKARKKLLKKMKRKGGMSKKSVVR